MVFLQKERIFPGVHKIGAPISGPRIADTNFTDTRIFLSFTASGKSAETLQKVRGNFTDRFLQRPLRERPHE